MLTTFKTFKTFGTNFFSMDYPSGCRVKFNCSRLPHGANIVFKARSKRFEYVLTVYETDRDDCQIIIDATRRHYKSNLQSEAKQVGIVSVIASIIRDYRSANGWIWKLGFVEARKNNQTN
jgi:hypothetical protein